MEDNMFSSIKDLSLVLGAIYGVVQALAQFVMLVAPKGTPVWRVSKALVAGPARPPPPSEFTENTDTPSEIKGG